MSFRFDRFECELTASVRTELPASWPSATDLGGLRGHIFQTREFVDAWSASFGRRSRRLQPLFIEISTPAGARLILLPLVLERRRGVTILSFMDQGHADYNAPLLAPEMASLGKHIPTEFWSELFANLPRFDVLMLAKMPQQVEGLDNPLLALAATRHAASSHGNDLEKSVKEIEAVLLSPKEVRSKERGLAQMGTVEFIVARGEDSGPGMLEELIKQKQRRFEETNVPGYGENPEALAFLHAAHRSFGNSGNALICGLLVGGEVTAVQWGLVHGRRFYALVTGFAGGKWTKYSCGRILNLRLLHWLKANGFSYFDQGYGDEAYKLKSSDTTVPLYDVIEAYSLRGRLYLWLEQLIERLRAQPLWERLRQLKWAIRRRL